MKGLLMITMEERPQMAPTATRFYLDRTQIAERVGLKDSKSVRQMENARRLLSPDVIVGDEESAGKVSHGWAEKRVIDFFQATGRLDANGNPVVGQKPGALSPEDQAKEAEFMARWTSVPKRYLGGRQVMAVLGLADASLHERRQQGHFPQPDVVIGKAPTRTADQGTEIPTTKTKRGVVHGWDAERIATYGRQEGLIKV